MFHNSTPLIAIIDTSVTHSIIVVDCLKIFCLVLSSMIGEMVIETPTKGSVTTSLVCLKCPLSILDKDFSVDLVCLPLSGLDVILGMNWLEFNYVHINCFKKSVRFLAPDEEEKVGLLFARKLNELIQDEAQVFSLMESFYWKSSYN